MVRTYSGKNITVSQSICYSFDQKTLQHEITYHDGKNHKYHVFTYDEYSFSKACEAFETLEELAKEYEANETA